MGSTTRNIILSANQKQVCGQWSHTGQESFIFLGRLLLNVKLIDHSYDNCHERCCQHSSPEATKHPHRNLSEHQQRRRHTDHLFLDQGLGDCALYHLYGCAHPNDNEAVELPCGSASKKAGTSAIIGTKLGMKFSRPATRASVSTSGIWMVHSPS